MNARLLLVLCLLLPTWVAADPLDTLFVELGEATTAAQAEPIEQEIWSQWMTGPNEEATEALKRVVTNMNQGEWTLAMVRLNDLINENPTYTEAWNKRATLHYMLGNADESIADIEQTLKQEPRHFGAWSGLGLILERRGQLRAALTAHREVLKLYPTSPSSRQRVESLEAQLLEQSI
ncbi:tetratricopeptide repeat protein [Reinekea blandensis]|uniref:Uncharacterized protein n=1 Tax=Reinekea blandensis MED297 TaxID=314283 RepID=A4BGC0_9GAMM|nr:tetratricopeptide repeat protein [Reinekea blandensis]EAR08915.1 hypothetical protein MED297_04577 [Reinekea sp. MED297] [Reinekea blandensis MED297]